jgi:hypothetical protein
MTAFRLVPMDLVRSMVHVGPDQSEVCPSRQENVPAVTSASIRTRYCLHLLAQELSPHCLCNNSIIVGIGWVKHLSVLSNSLLTLYGGYGSNHIIDPGVRSMRTYSIMSRVAITANAIGVYIEDTRHDSGKSGEHAPCSSLSNLPRGLSCLAEHLIGPSGLSEDLQG